MKKLWHWFLASALISMLMACGGGGGGTGVPTGSTSPDNFLVNSPGEVTLTVGQKATFPISGGKTPYIASSTVPGIARASIENGNLVVLATSLGSATIRVAPSGGGAEFSLSVTVVTNVSPLVVQAPSVVTMGIGKNATYVLLGGVPPYKAVSSDDTLLNAEVSGSQLKLTGIRAGAVTVSVYDSDLSRDSPISTTVNVVDATPLNTSAPSSGLTIARGATRTFVVAGGVAPYFAESNNATVLETSVSGSSLSLKGVANGSAVVTLRDSANSLLTVSATVTVPVPFFSTAPNTGLVVGIGLVRDFDVGGGVLPYATPVSSDELVATASFVGATLRITGRSTGTATITVRDAAGTSLNISVAVGSSDALLTTAPSALTMDGETVRSFEVSGGTGYAAQSSNNSIVVANIPTTPGLDTKALLTLTAISNGSATVSVTDSRGRSISLSITVVNGSGSGVVSSVDVTTDKLSLLSASGESTITAFVKNAANVAMPNIPVQFSADSGTLLSADTMTNESGVATAKLSPGSNRANRAITVIATAGVKSGSVKVDVTGSTLTITGSSTQQLGATGSYSVRAVDSSGNPLAGMVLTGVSSLGNTFTSNATTDATGNASFSYTAVRSGVDTLTVTGLGTMKQTLGVTISAVNLSFATPASNASVNVGTSQTVTVRYLVGGVAQSGVAVSFSSTRGAVSAASVVTNASGQASVNVSSLTAGPATITAQIAQVGTATLPLTFVATTPATITLQGTPSAVAPNQQGSSANQSTLSAVVRDASGNLVAGQVVNFNLVSDLSGGSLSAGTSVTDASGRAQVQFISGAASTPANGVQVSATVAGKSTSALLTVSGSALFISFGISNEIGNLDPTIYSKRFAVYVTDANGVSVGNQVVNLSVIPTQYGKGTLSYDSVVGAWGYSAGSPTVCPNEDKNGNGILDLVPSSEDTNDDGRLTPGNVVVASPGVLTTDSSGRAFFDLQYGEQYVPWLDVRLSARASVSGTESISVSEFSLVGVVTDFTNENAPAGVRSPFGTTASCSTSN